LWYNRKSLNKNKIMEEFPKVPDSGQGLDQEKEEADTEKLEEKANQEK